MAHPPPHDALLAPDWVSSTDAYARRFDGPVGQLLLDVQARGVLELLAPWPGATVLDVGGGHAQLAAPLRRAGYAPTVLASHPALHRRVRRLGVAGIRCVAGRIEDPPFRDRSFDVVVCMRMVGHAEDWTALLRGLARVAREAVVVDYSPRRSVNFVAPLLFWAKQGVEGDTRRFRVLADNAVAAPLRAAGFPHVRVARQLLLPVVLHRLGRSPGLSAAGERLGRATGLTRLLGSPALLRASRAAPPG